MIAAAVFLVAGGAVAKDGKVSVAIPIGSYQINDTDEGHEIIMDDFGSLLIPGKPLLPARIFSIAIPPGAKVKDVAFETGDSIVLEGSYQIPPAPAHRVVGIDGTEFNEEQQKRFDQNHKATYGSSSLYPAAKGEFVRTSGYRKYTLVDVNVTPFAYRPASGTLEFTPDITVHVSYSLPDTLPSNVLLEDYLIRTEMKAREIVLNYNQAQGWYPKGVSSGGRGLYDYVIITLDTLTTAVQPLVNWEVSKGRTVYVATTSWINTNYTGYDVAERMRNFLRDKYPSSEWGIEDVCIVGHYDNVPMRRCWQDLGYGKPETDFYFAELSKPDSTSWDADGDHQWGENSDPIDFYGEVNVGRIPWSTPATVTHICDKSVAYENNNDPSFKKNILLLGAFFWPDTDNAVLMEYKTNPATHPWMSDWTSTKMYEQGHSSYPFDYNLTYNNVRNQWSAGKYAFVNWAGHGNPTGCYIYYSGGAFVDTGTCPSLNDDYPAIIFADACSNSDTDYSNLGQNMLKQGGVGFVGSTKVALGCPGWKSPNYGSSQSMDYYFTTYVTSGDYSQGAAHQKALTDMYTKGLWGYNKYETFEWGALWGNPDLRLEMTPVLALKFPQGLPSGNYPPGPESPMTLEIKDGLENYVPGTGTLHYRFDSSDPYSTVPVTALGGDLYEAVLPNTKPGDEPEFYFSAQGDGSTTVYSPFDAPNDVYSFDVYFEEVLFHDDFETNKGWTVTNENLTDGAWDRGVPVGGGDRGDPPTDYDGSGKCYLTDNVDGNSDVDGGPTRLISPTIDLSSGTAEICYCRWHSNDDNDDWFQVQISNDNGTTWKLVEQVKDTSGWIYRTFNAGTYVTPTAQIKMRFNAVDNPNDSVTEAGLDAFKVRRIITDPSLWADAYSISVTEHAVVDFSMDAGAGNANRQYLLMGTLSGTTPGFLLPGGQHVPLNWDAFTNVILTSLNGPIFQNFLGNLDGMGTATATFDTLGPVGSAMLGLTADFVFILSNPPAWNFASNPIAVTFDP